MKIASCLDVRRVL